MVNAIDYPFSTLRPTPFLYVKMGVGALQNHSADVMRSDTQSGVKPPHECFNHFKLGEGSCRY